MGVTKLWTILEEASRFVKLESLSGKILAVDASIWMYQFLKGFRDKDGNFIKNGHIIGFFRRICKLLFYGIKPIFVFDGNISVLKENIIKKRTEKRLKYDENSEKLAEKIFLLQMKKTVQKDIQGKKQNNKLKKSPYFENMENLSKDIEIIQKNGNRDIYNLPSLNVSFEQIQQSDDFRMTSQGNIQESIHNFTNEDLNSLDFSKIDYDSDFFKSLLPADQYNILNIARLRSRLRMGLRADELMTMFSNSMEFSKFQITKVKERNDLTQRLLNFNEINKAGALRVVGEPNREYLLVKDEDTKTGWVLNFDLKNQKNLIVINDEDHDSTHEDEEFEDIPLYDINSSPMENIGNFLIDDSEKEIFKKTDDYYKINCHSYNIKNKPLFLELDDFDINLECNEHVEKMKRDEKKIEHSKNNQFNDELKLNNIRYQSTPNSEENIAKSRRLKSNNKLSLPQFDIFSKSNENSENHLKTKVLVPKNEISKLNQNFEPLSNLEKSGHILNLSKPSFRYNKISSQNLLNNTIFLEENIEEPQEVYKSRNKKESFILFTDISTLKENSVFLNNFKAHNYFVDKNISHEDNSKKALDIKINLESIKNISAKNTSIKETDSKSDKFMSLSIPIVDNCSEIELVANNYSNSSNKNQEKSKIGADSIHNISDIDEYDDYNLDLENDTLTNYLLEENEEHNRFFSELNKTNDSTETNIEKDLDLLMNRYRKTKKNADSVTQIMIEECQNLLKLFGIPYIIAPMEAEAQCAELLKLGLVDGIITDDSDVFLFGGTKVYRNMFNHSKYVELYLLSDLEREFNLGRKNLIRLAHLLGSDYTEGIPKIGPVTALEILSDFPNSDSLNEFKEWYDRVKDSKETQDDETSKFRYRFKKNIYNILLPKDFPNPLVDKAYLEPEVDSNFKDFEWGIPDLDNLRDFLVSTVGWSLQKINEMIIPVIRNMNFKRMNMVQTVLTDYWFIGSNIFISKPKISNKATRFTKALNNLKRSGKTTYNQHKILNSESTLNENIANASKNFLEFGNSLINVKNKDFDIINKNINYTFDNTKSFSDNASIMNTQKYKKNIFLNLSRDLNEKKDIFKNIKRKQQDIS
ncbi:hypothetical protein PNEG_03117 [Pneumocystis murina B123]|uniref:DNA repair protein RAD2 n=1 Tax=Pneumocystis murina (strain B123) TaxID=1069680 RepID=M7NNE6_PNEMU|nr:hypothetical protein PNEG_03117 [Pneumocystis murina B123]EMR08641.1 hypothetical protein PNEG_03117 [Pneumocystis murina B123]